ncbi:MAG: hypothetical protein WDO16_23095 [Bacteroidota bacterium]
MSASHDWFFFKKNIELKYIGLENAIIHMQRTDSVWNHQFIVNYFSTPSSGKKDKDGIQLNLKKIELNNVILRQKDAWTGKDMIIALRTFDLDAKEINFAKKQININSLLLADPIFSEYKYTGRRPASIQTGTTLPPKADSLLKWNAEGWIVQLDKLTIKNGLFKEDRQSESPVLPYFDGRHIAFRDINGVFTNLHWEKDTITAHVDLNTKERSGFEVKKLVADMKLTPQEMSFAGLDIETNNSTIRIFTG